VVLRKDDVEPAALRSAALALINAPEVAARCQALARELRDAGGAARAADSINGYVRG